MFARKAVAQSLAREFGPQGIHVSHVIIDGMIDTPGLRERMGEDKDEKVLLLCCQQGGSANIQRLNPDDIAEVGPFYFVCGRSDYIDLSLLDQSAPFGLDTRA